MMYTNSTLINSVTFDLGRISVQWFGLFLSGLLIVIRRKKGLLAETYLGEKR